ncbi:hypothetical protein BGX28_009249 [Mortierella sp. GBA30]|nr:hypothetical protein BGX28_009249 [Mortierella sp. GBA30]
MDGQSTDQHDTSNQTHTNNPSDIINSVPEAPSTASTRVSIPPDFPVVVTLLPNKGRSYVATRTIQPQELVFVAEAFGTTMCDPWLDCGICHYCWTNIPDRKAQIRLPMPQSNNKNSKKVEAVMVFCDETCLQLYGPEMAETICRVEQKVRRTWNDTGARHWTLRTSKPKEIRAKTAAAEEDKRVASAFSVGAPYPSLVHQAKTIAGSKEEVLCLSDKDLAEFLNCVWGALDELIAEQESFILRSLEQQKGASENTYTQKQYEALYPTLAKYLLEGIDKSSIAAKTSDDDCEVVRLMSEILYRRQLDILNIATEYISPLSLSKKCAEGSNKAAIQGQRATFADYCAMQSNELVLVRQQLMEEMSSQEQEEADSTEAALVAAEAGDHNEHMGHWRELLSILPSHLLSCFYVYLRLRDAYLLLKLEENTKATIPSVTLTIDNTLFRTILYREVANSFGIRDASDELLGFAVFPRASFFNHSCRPNIQKKRRQGEKARQMEYWSTGVIQAGEECCINYGDISSGLEERQERLEDMYFFRCSCPRCLEEEEVIRNGQL